MRIVFLIAALFAWNTAWPEGELKSRRVPTEIEFAGMRLKITTGARQEIQKDVDALRKSRAYFDIKADRAKLYFPIIERVLKAEKVPTDFKYLALQESALISDAVSSANAVGFWQFKDFTGREVGLRIDRNIDERLNIASSTKGAAKYFKRHNFFFDNWFYSLLAHYTGRGGASKYVDRSNFGKKKMTVDKNTHWYVKRFLAHKIAFEGAVEGRHSEGFNLREYQKGQGKTIEQIARSTKSDEAELKKYNKWLKHGNIPSDKTYVVIIPGKGRIRQSGKEKPASRQEIETIETTDEVEEVVTEKVYPSINASRTIFITINGIPSVLAKNSDNIPSLAAKSKLTPEQFARYNDLSPNEKIIEGQIYYMKSKRNKARVYYYTVKPGETLWDVSQKFGIKKVKLAKLNRMMTIDELKPGRELWMKKRRPEDVAVEMRELSQLPVDETLDELTKPKPITIPTLPMDTTQIDAESVANTKAPESELKKTNKDPVQVSENVFELGSYLVKKGETLYAIARNTGVSVEDLVEWNALYNAVIKPGQTLIIHGAGVQEEAIRIENITFHVVERGDTMFGISKKYSVSIEKLLMLNQKENFDLSVGEKIMVTD